MTQFTLLGLRITHSAIRVAVSWPRVSFILVLAAMSLLASCGDGTGEVIPSPVPATLTSTVPLFTPSPVSSPQPATPTATPAATSTRVVPSETTARQLRVFTQLWETVRDTYVYPDLNGLDWDDVYRRYKSRVEAGVDDREFYQLMREMIDALGDDHSVFLSPEDAAEEERELTGQLDYVGIGIYVTTFFEKGYAVLLQVFPDSPAAQAGLRSHDLILAVDGVPVIGEHGEDNLDLLSGPADSEVQLLVQTPGQEPRELVMTRKNIQTQLQVEAYRLPGTEIGYIFIPTFWDQTMANRVIQALENLMADGELEGLVVDMRINDGGIGSVLRDTLSIFTSGELGVFVSRDTERPLIVEASPVGNSHALPLVVLVGQETVSFAEIFCGLLQESGRAWIVGRTSTGNVEVQWPVDFEDGSRVWLASETFRPPSGADWEKSGIVPDLEIPLSWDEFTSEDDPQLDAAVEWLLQELNK